MRSKRRECRCGFQALFLPNPLEKLGRTDELLQTLEPFARSARRGRSLITSTPSPSAAPVCAHARPAKRPIATKRAQLERAAISSLPVDHPITFCFRFDPVRTRHAQPPRKQGRGANCLRGWYRRFGGFARRLLRHRRHTPLARVWSPSRAPWASCLWTCPNPCSCASRASSILASPCATWSTPSPTGPSNKGCSPSRRRTKKNKNIGLLFVRTGATVPSRRA